jgi:hypothetical protein
MVPTRYLCWGCGDRIGPPVERWDVFCQLCLVVRLHDLEAEIREQSPKEPPKRWC